MPKRKAKYIKMPINPVGQYNFEDFKARFLELTNMSIQENPLENVSGTHYLVGTEKLSDATQDMIKAEFPQVTYTNHAFPPGWVTKEQ